jgi:hypothetical protein
LIHDGVAARVFRPVDPQFFYFTVIGAADRFFSARLVLPCSDRDVLDEALRDHTARISTISSWRAFWCDPPLQRCTWQAGISA